MIDKRIECVLDIDDEQKIDSIWNDYFNFGKEKPFEKVIQTCLCRPRDIIYFIGKMFESACNNSKTCVDVNDFQYALQNYTGFLYQNIIAEMNAVYPYIKDIIDHLHKKFDDKIELNKFESLINHYEKNTEKSQQLFSDLFAYGYIICINKKNRKKNIYI